MIILHTFLGFWVMLICFAEACGHTINLPPPVLPHPLFILSCCVAEVRYGHAKAGSTQERGIQSNRGELLGVDFRQPLGEFEESGRRQSSRDESTDRGKVLWTLPCSPAQQHPTQHTGPVFPTETLSVIQLYKRSTNQTCWFWTIHAFIAIFLNW